MGHGDLTASCHDGLCCHLVGNDDVADMVLCTEGNALNTTASRSKSSRTDNKQPQILQVRHWRTSNVDACNALHVTDAVSCVIYSF